MKKLKIGDKVIDIDENYQPVGEFIIEEINDEGWIWGSGRIDPYYDEDKKKNFSSPYFTRKI